MFGPDERERYLPNYTSSTTRPVPWRPFYLRRGLPLSSLQAQEALAISEQDPLDSSSHHHPVQETSLAGGSLGMYGWWNRVHREFEFL